MTSPQPSEETTEILNPNVAEFVPKNLEGEDDNDKSPPEDEVDGGADGGKSLEESWRGVKRL